MSSPSDAPGDRAALDSLAAEEFVLLTTFRADGTPVGTPVWIVPDGPVALVITGATSGKVKRLRREPVAALQACDRAGAPTPGAPVHRFEVHPDPDPDRYRHASSLVRRKYGLLGRVLTLKTGKRVREGSTMTLVVSVPGATPAP